MDVNNFSQIQLSKKYKIAVVVSRFNEKITGGLLAGAEVVLLDHKKNITNYEIFKVPGAIEIPLIAKKCAKNGNFDAIICLGAVIRGDTPHFDYVCKYVTEGILQINLVYEIVTAYGVITTENLVQAEVRSALNESNKGREAALAALEMLSLIELNPDLREK